jgi:hypothetical protein
MGKEVIDDNKVVSEAILLITVCKPNSCKARRIIE